MKVKRRTRCESSSNDSTVKSASARGASWQGRLLQVGGSVLKVSRSFYVEEGREGADKLKEELVRLGPVFIKLGQAIACRPDLFGSRVTESLADLHDNCEAFSSREAAEVLREELGEDVLQNRFLETEEGGKFWECPPCACASLGQVYRARVLLRRGSKPVEVAVKVQRPRVKEQIELDINLLDRTLGRVPFFKPIVDLVGDTLLDEVDYLKEASNAEEFSAIQRDVPFVLVPKPLLSLTTRKVLVLEWVEGESLKEIGDEKEKLLKLTKMAVQCTIAQLLLSNVLHGDPHPGNLLYTGDGRLAYLDFGVLCRVKRKQAQALLSASVHIMNKQYREFITDLAALEVLDDQKVSIPKVVDAFDREFSQNQHLTDQVKLNKAMTKLGYVYKFNVPPWYTTLVRALAPLEGYGLRADPNFNILDVCYPLIMKQICFDSSVAGKKILREFLLTCEEGGREDQESARSGNQSQEEKKRIEVVNFSLLRGMSLQSMKSLIQEFVPIMVSSRARGLRSTLKKGQLPKSVHQQQKGIRALFHLVYLFAFFLAQALKTVVLPGIFQHKLLAGRSGRIRRNRLKRLKMTLWDWTQKYNSSLCLSNKERPLKLSLAYLQTLILLFLSSILSIAMLVCLFAVDLKDRVGNLFGIRKMHPTL